MIDIDKIVLEWSSRVEDRKLDAKNSHHRKILKEVLQYFNHSDKFIDAFLYNLKDHNKDLYTEAIKTPKLLIAFKSKMKSYKFKPKNIEYWFDQLDKYGKVSTFYNFWKKLPGGDKVRPATAKVMEVFSEKQIDEFVSGFGASSAPIKSATIRSGMEKIMFNIDASGIGKGEVMWAWKTMANVQGGGESFDLQIGSVKYEVKDYSGSKGSIRAGVEASVSKFPFWTEILETVKIIRKIESGDDLWSLFPASKDLEQLKNLKTYILDRVEKEVKVVTGEFNKTDVKKFKEFYIIANRMLAAKDDKFNQVIFQGANQKPYSIEIKPIDLEKISSSGKIEIQAIAKGGESSLATLTNYLNKLLYVRTPNQWEPDLQAAVDAIITGGPAKYWMIFRGSEDQPDMKIIPKNAGNFHFTSISQNGVKFKELMP